MDRPLPINLTKQIAPKTIKINLVVIKDPNFSFLGVLYNFNLMVMWRDPLYQLSMVIKKKNLLKK